MMNVGVLTLFAALGAFQAASAFYLPGLAPVNYCEKDVASEVCPSTVPLFVNRLDTKRSVVPFEYSQFDFCTSDDEYEEAPGENLGQILFGERIRASPYKFQFKQDESCKTVCEKKYDLSKKSDRWKLERMVRGISRGYTHHWIVDNMPATWCFVGRRMGRRRRQVEKTYCLPGFPMGCFVRADGMKRDVCSVKSGFWRVWIDFSLYFSFPAESLDLMNEKETAYVFNHIQFVINYVRADSRPWGETLPNADKTGRIVRVDIQPYSVDYTADNANCEKPTQAKGISVRHIREHKEGELKIKYTYSVKWVPREDIFWASRWDYILESAAAESRIQWFSILNSCLIVVFLSGMLVVTLVRLLKRDIIKYNKQIDGTDEDDAESALEEFGWKLVHGDVFRAPRWPMLLSVLLGIGVQLLIMAGLTLLLACLGFLSPANRGALMTSALVSFVLLGTPAGYVSARMYKMFGGVQWKKLVLLSATMCQGMVFGVFFLMNLILWAKRSSAAVPFGTLIAVLALWLLVSAPLCFLGAFLGFRKGAITYPVRTNQIPRQIPTQPPYNQLPVTLMLGGVLPFGCIFIQLYFILTSIWAHQTYYMFGFLFIVILILCLTCSETTILLTYFQLCSENYHWWWRSYLSSAATGAYVFLYSTHFFFTKLEITDLASGILYFGYSLIMAFVTALITAAIGFFATFAFVRKIYASIKID